MLMKTYANKLTFASITSLILFSYISTSGAALSHIFLFPSIIMATYIYYKRNELKFTKSMWSLLALIIISILSILIAPDITDKVKKIFKVKYFILGLGGIYSYKLLFESLKLDRVKVLINIFLVLLIVGNVAGIHALFSGFHYLRMKPSSDLVRAAGMYGMAITYGYGISFIAIIFTSILMNYYKSIEYYTNKWLFIISYLTCLFGLYFSYTRGAILSFVLSLPIVFILTRKKLFKILVAGCGVFLVALIIFFISAGDTDPMFGNRIFLKAKTGSNMIRLSQYESALKAFQEKPILGFGYRNFEDNVARIKDTYDIPHKHFIGHAHSNYLEFLAGTGLLGFLSFMSFTIFWIIELFKRNDDISVIFLPFVYIFAMTGLFQSTIIDGENTFVVMFIYGLSQAIPKGFQFKKLSEPLA